MCTNNKEKPFLVCILAGLRASYEYLYIFLLVFNTCMKPPHHQKLIAMLINSICTCKIAKTQKLINSCKFKVVIITNLEPKQKSA